MTRYVFVTGAFGGLGRNTADLFAANGWHVFAADRQLPAAAPGITPIEVDVTSSAALAAAAEEVAKVTSSLDAVINFAGVLETGQPWMEVPEAAIRRSFDVNVIGTMLVNQTFFPFIRTGRGRIVNVASAAATMPPMPISGPYQISKLAVEDYSDSLRRELMFVGIPVIIIEPGTFRTPMTGTIAAKFDPDRNPTSPFNDLVRKIGKQTADEDAKGADAKILAEAVYAATTAAKPKHRYPVNVSRSGPILRKLPSRALDRLVRRMFA